MRMHIYIYIYRYIYIFEPQTKIIKMQTNNTDSDI